MCVPIAGRASCYRRSASALGAADLAKDACVLRVPSIVLPEEYNLVFNPLHPDASKLRTVDHRSFTFDGRLERTQARPSYDRFTEYVSGLASWIRCQGTCPYVLGLSPDHAAVLPEHATDVGQRLALHECGYDPLLLLRESPPQRGLNPGPLRALFSHMGLSLPQIPWIRNAFRTRVKCATG